MISKNKKKFLASLIHKKYRRKYMLFTGEGHKINHDLLTEKIPCSEIFATSEWIDGNRDILPENVTEATMGELKSVSNLKTPPQVIGVYEISDHTIDMKAVSNSLVLALDGVQDPGNLGTIIRIADWFGIDHIICSEDSADVYNPKVVQATMGAIARVKVYHLDLPAFLADYKKETGKPVYGTFLEGENIYDVELSKAGVIVMGNEGNGITKEVEKFITEKLFIPGYPPGLPVSESLNVAVATAVVCSEFRRRVVSG